MIVCSLLECCSACSLPSPCMVATYSGATSLCHHQLGMDVALLLLLLLLHSLEVFTPSYSTYAAHLPAAYGSHHLAVAYLQVALALAKGRG